jgi:hypothetical protein
MPLHRVLICALHVLILLLVLMHLLFCIVRYVPKKLQAPAGAGDPVEELDARIARLREEEERQKEEKVYAI